MKWVCLCFLVATVNQCLGQTKTSIEKWGRAAINLDCRPSKNLLPDTKISEFRIGSALFLLYNNVHYLITARHVVEDKEEINSAFTKDPDPICYKIFVVERGDSVARYREDVMLTDLGGEPLNKRTYIFSREADDIAVISLRTKRDFVDRLLAKGYVPVSVDDIDTNCSLVQDQKITALGFPGDLFETGRQASITLGQFATKSPVASMPVITEGTVGDIGLEKNTFVGNIFVTKGNSGGPVISDDKLVGIVSRQITTFKRVAPGEFGYYRSRQFHFIKSSLILPLVERLDKAKR